MITLDGEKLQISEYGLFLDSIAIVKLIGKPLYKSELLKFGDRSLAKIQDNEKQLWCDSVTGHLYNQNLQCLSNNNVLLYKPINTGKKIPKPKHLAPLRRNQPIEVTQEE